MQIELVILILTTFLLQPRNALVSKATPRKLIFSTQPPTLQILLYNLTGTRQNLHNLARLLNYESFDFRPIYNFARVNGGFLSELRKLPKDSPILHALLTIEKIQYASTSLRFKLFSLANFDSCLVATNRWNPSYFGPHSAFLIDVIRTRQLRMIDGYKWCANLDTTFHIHNLLAKDRWVLLNSFCLEKFAADLTIQRKILATLMEKTDNYPALVRLANLVYYYKKTQEPFEVSGPSWEIVSDAIGNDKKFSEAFDLPLRRWAAKELPPTQLVSDFEIIFVKLKESLSNEVDQYAAHFIFELIISALERGIPLQLLRPSIGTALSRFRFDDVSPFYCKILLNFFKDYSELVIHGQTFKHAWSHIISDDDRLPRDYMTFGARLSRWRKKALYYEDEASLHRVTLDQLQTYSDLNVELILQFGKFPVNQMVRVLDNKVTLNLLTFFTSILTFSSPPDATISLIDDEVKFNCQNPVNRGYLESWWVSRIAAFAIGKIRHLNMSKPLHDAIVDHTLVSDNELLKLCYVGTDLDALKFYLNKTRDIIGSFNW